ncbi:TPA: hypothetical protein PXP39_003361 [Yersinia enterocolitica]|nr:hypothetical protein [Yersinia enterocolitica]HDL7833444.1 hypothetical protein [Yersinia enterocolitica]HDL7874000.1 hypothetical protein [Yersinia enterocolitica]HDL7886686.1 hypothetical protein [Yersinia enterocolitica]HDL7894995.1 hypothetical protein [Yersinia enterocolitica]
MKVNYKQLIIGLLLLVQFPVANAKFPVANANSGNILYTDSYNMFGYERCSVKLLDDNSVEVSFYAQFNPVYTLSSKPEEKVVLVLGELLNISPNDAKHIKFNPHRALLSLYFYHADGTRDSTIQLNNISDISLNGIITSGSNENAQRIQFNSRLLPLLSGGYDVSFKIPANTLKNISIGATIGGEFSYKGQSHSFLSAEGVSFSSDGKRCERFYPQADLAPEALKIDPKFRMDSAVWQLKTLDLDELLDNTANNRGWPTQIINAGNNRFCINYRSIATRNTQYMISATNINGLASNNQHFQLKEQQGNNFINYMVKLNSNDNAGADFEFPKDTKYINLKSDDNQVISDMCWEPNITLFSTENTDKGSYSDTLNFTITPLA